MENTTHIRTLRLVPNLNLVFAPETRRTSELQRQSRSSKTQWYLNIDLSMAESAIGAHDINAVHARSPQGVDLSREKGGQLSPISAMSRRILGSTRPAKLIRRDNVVVDPNFITPPTAYKPLQMVSRSSASETPKRPRRDVIRRQPGTPQVAQVPKTMLPRKGAKGNRRVDGKRDDPSKVNIPPLAFRPNAMRTPRNPPITSQTARLEFKSLNKTDRNYRTPMRAMSMDFSSSFVDKGNHGSDVHLPTQHMDISPSKQGSHPDKSAERRRTSDLLGESIAGIVETIHGDNGRAADRKTGQTAVSLQVNNVKSQIGSVEALAPVPQVCDPESDLGRPSRPPKNATFRPSSAVLESPFILLELLGQSGELMIMAWSHVVC